MTDKPRILIVEDEQSVATIMAHVLIHAGCDVEIVLNTHQAMRLAQKGEFDIITLDVNMIGMCGFEMCRRLKQLASLRDTPVIFVSGQTSEDHIRRGFDAGAVDYIIKPFLPMEFVARILSHIRHAPATSRRLNDHKNSEGATA